MTVKNPYPFNPLPWNAYPHDFSGNNNLGPYSEETVQRYIPGTRFTTWDGRVFKYGRSITALVSAWGAFNNSHQVNIAVDSEENPVVGKRSLTFDLGGDDGYAGTGVAENELAGGYITTGHGEEKCQTRLIVGNTAAAQSTSVTIYTDFPWSNACTTDTTPWTEVVLNPYRYLNRTVVTDARCACMGIGAEGVGALKYCWIQTYGPCYCVGTGSTSNAANQSSIYMAGNGSVQDGSEATIENGQQLIGYTIDATATGTMPLVMLQISI